MADYINNVAAGDAYTAACTIGPDFDANFVVLTIANNPALLQFAVGVVGNWRWTDEREFFSIPQSFRVGNVVGVRVRNANAGSVARVLAVLAGGDDPDFQSGMPFAGILSATGGISVTGGLTGIVNANGTIAAGSGFTVNHTGTGVYVITFTNPFTTTPVVLVTPIVAVGNAEAFVTAVSPNSVTIEIFGGAGVDEPFNFIAQPVV